MRRAAGLVLLLTVLTVLAACAPATVTPPPGTPADPTTSAPTRPRDIDISGILPCELLTDAQLADLQLDGEPNLYTSRDALFGVARTCNIRRFDIQPAVVLGVTLVVEHGIERFGESGVAAPAERREILGYPAVLSRPRPSMADNCLIAVDISPGQMVGVLLSDGGNDPQIPLDQLCREVPRYAEAVMTTLVGR